MVDMTDDFVAEPAIKAPCDLKAVFKQECSLREYLVQNTDMGQKMGGYAEADRETVNNGRRTAPQAKGPGQG